MATLVITPVAHPYLESLVASTDSSSSSNNNSSSSSNNSSNYSPNNIITANIKNTGNQNNNNSPVGNTTNINGPSVSSIARSRTDSSSSSIGSSSSTSSTSSSIRARSRNNSSSSIGSSSSSCSTTSSRRTKSALPPCKVCGNQGTGFHYGANTCEACKGFFRRSILRKKPYNCRGDEKLCRIEPQMRSLCSHCRFQKCLQIGMSVDGIKTGRYTLEKKRQDTMELKRLAKEQAEVRHLSDVALRHQNSHRMVEAIIGRFWDVFSDVINMRKDLPVLLQDYVDVRQLRADLFGPMRTVPVEEFVDALSTTGLQVDDRLDIMNAFFQKMTPLLERSVHFLKSMQGFKGLDLHDQIALLKASWVETWLAIQHQAVNTEHRCYAFAYGGMSIELDKVLGEELGQCIVTVAKRLQPLNLNMEDCVLLQVFLVFSPDLPGLKEPQKIAAIQNQLLEALLWALHKNHPENKLIFPQLISAMLEMKTTQVLAMRLIQDYLVALVEQGYVQMPEIIREIIIGSSECKFL